MTLTFKVIVFCFSFCVTSSILALASSSEEWDYLRSHLNDPSDQSEAANSLGKGM